MSLGQIKDYTPNFNLIIPRFDIATWHDYMESNFRSIDALFFNMFGINQYRGEWQNSTTYQVGDVLFIGDPDSQYTGRLVKVLVAHTTTANDSFDVYYAHNPINYDLFMDAAAAEQSAKLAREWAIKTDGKVQGLDYSAKYYANLITPISAEIVNVSNISNEVINVSSISSNITSVDANSTNIKIIASMKPDIDDVVAIKTDIEWIADNDSIVTNVSNNSTKITTVANNINSVNTNATNIADINTNASNISSINTTASNISDINTTVLNINDINTTASISNDISTVANIASDVTSVVNNATDISAVAANNTNISAVANNETNINAVNNNKTNIDLLATNMTDITDVAANMSTISAVNNNSTNINAVNSNKTNINTVADISPQITSLARRTGGIDIISNSINNINTVATNISNVHMVAGNILDVNSVATNIASIHYVLNDLTNIDTVATNINDVNAVAADLTNINAVSSNSSNINAVNANKTNIDTVASNSSNINTVSTNISDVNTAATNITAIQNALTYATNAANSANLAEDWATKMNGLVDNTDYSAKYYADQARQAATGAVIDTISISRNSDDELQTIGVINQNNTTSAIKTWTGTLAQYNAIVTKDSNTLYNITDDNTAVAYQAYTKSETDTVISNAISDILNLMYPVGSIYICTNSVCPLGALINGSVWSLVARNRVLQGTNATSDAGTTKEAGLPNITGGFWDLASTQDTTNGNMGNAQGAFRTLYLSNNGTGQATAVSYGKTKYDGISFDASRSSSIYGNSNTVQPPAYLVNIWERVV